VFDAVNHCIQHDTSVLQFVTVFYGILDPATGELLYCNAGHCPGYLFRADDYQQAEELRPSGAALGLLDGTSWTRESVQLAEGDLLVLYTDGVTEARNEREELFDNERLLASVRACLDAPNPREITAQQVQDAILEDVLQFAGSAPQSDDIALAVLVRA
jgi:sigma-B regulation protein RsbU (phosphoserine phosphatase)